MTLQTMQRTKINGVELEVRDQGSGEPVLFIHGAMGDECAAIVAEPALVNNYRVIDYHRRGWGHSQSPESPVSIEQQAADVRAIMQHLGIDRAHIVGQSYGGAILLQMALDFPDAVHSLALLEPGLPSILFKSPEFGALGEKAGGFYSQGDKVGAMTAFGQGVAGDNFRTVFDQNLPPGNFDRWVADADTIFQRDIPALEPWSFSQADAARIAQPVLNMSGQNTTPYFREIYETVRDWFPQAENFIVPNATHAMLQTNPPGSAARLAEFCADHPLQQ